MVDAYGRAHKTNFPACRNAELANLRADALAAAELLSHCPHTLRGNGDCTSPVLADLIARLRGDGKVKP